MKSKEKIVHSLIDLMKTKEFETITIKELTKNAKVNRSTYYYNFKSKDDIIKYQLNEIMSEYIGNFDLVDVKNEETYIYTALKTYYKYKNFLLTIYKSNKIYIFQQVYLENIENMIKMDTLKNLYGLYYHLGGFYNFIVCWIGNGMSGDINVLSKVVLEFMGDYNPLLFN